MMPKMPNKKLLLGTVFLRYFGLTKVPMILYLRPSLVEWTRERVVIKIPLNRRSKNHLGSMYFGALAAGADLATGFVAVNAIRESGQDVSFVFKDMRGEFLKRAEGDTHFICEEAVLVADLVEKALETDERVDLLVPVTVTCPSQFKDEPVAKFALTLSLKRRSDKKR